MQMIYNAEPPEKVSIYIRKKKLLTFFLDLDFS